MAESSVYVLGHADAEVERLQLQGQILEPFTRRLIGACGIHEGMRVLELGCGVGDVSLLLAEAVGTSGRIVAVDREMRAVDIARRRATQAGHLQIEFAVSTDEDLAAYPPFDAAFGRYILIHQPDPTLLVRRAAAAVRRGGVVAFEEAAYHLGPQMTPPVDLWQNMTGSMIDFFRAAFPQYDAAGRLISCFEDAGLQAPNLLWESLAGGPQAPYLRYVAVTYEVFLPHIKRLGLLREEVGDPATLYERLVAAATAARVQFASVPEVGAWATCP